MRTFLNIVLCFFLWFTPVYKLKTDDTFNNNFYVCSVEKSPLYRKFWDTNTLLGYTAKDEKLLVYNNGDSHKSWLEVTSSSLKKTGYLQTKYTKPCN